MRGDRPLIRAIRGPVILITLGVLFALQNFSSITFWQTWPVLLIVIGLLSLFGRAAGPAPPPKSNWPPPAGGYRASYTQGPYPQPPQSAPPEAGSGGPQNPPGSNPGGSV